MARTGIDPARIDDVMAGCAIPVGEQAGNVARHAALAAGLPESVPGTTVDRKCGSSLQALQFAAQAVAAGDADAVLVGGVDMMGTVPMKANRLGRDDLGPRLRARYPDGLGHQGIAAELIAARWKLSREECDAWSLRSHRRAAAARDSGFLDRQVIPVPRPDGTVVTADEGIRAGATIDGLAGLRPAFYDEAAARRWPEIDWVVTAGSSSQISDGASAALVVAEDAVGPPGPRPPGRRGRRGRRRHRSDPHADGADAGHREGPGPGGAAAVGHRPVRGQRGVRPRRPGLAGRDRCRSRPRQRLRGRHRPRPSARCVGVPARWPRCWTGSTK